MNENLIRDIFRKACSDCFKFLNLSITELSSLLTYFVFYSR